MMDAFRELFDEKENENASTIWCGCVASSSGYCSLIEHQLQGRAEREADMHSTVTRTDILTLAVESTLMLVQFYTTKAKVDIRVLHTFLGPTFKTFWT